MLYNNDVTQLCNTVVLLSKKWELTCNIRVITTLKY